MSKFNELVTKLREVFQIDRPELDFGVYRILNARADEINEYLEKRLKEKVEQALASGNAANIDQLKEDLKKAEQAATDAGFDPAESPKVKELKAKITQASSGNTEHENVVFSHLLTFFSRYYDNGDFISQRRYKGDTYAIPYAGEEVMLHWANKDQYYIKSGENFSNYSFKLEDGREVHFRLVAADTAKDNRKDNDKERRFVLAEHKIITRIDDKGEEYKDEILPVEEIAKTDAEGNETKELIIRFEYKAIPKGRKQDKLVEAAVDSVLADGTVASCWVNLSKREPTEKNPKRTLLAKHLTNYTTKNTADYFIHKNLGKFLRGELDFYIKNEVMHLDDVQNAEAFNDIEKNLRMIQCLRSIALDLIKFLAQLEDFQKKLWAKKKFVVNTNYYISIDLIDESFINEIVENTKQWDTWRALGMWNSEKDGNCSDLLNNPRLFLDLGVFSYDFRNRLISSIDDLQANEKGLLIHGDNYQANKLIGEKYSRSVDCVYIDPPYNAKSSEILYKNTFRDSSWLSLMDTRLRSSKKLLAEDSVYIVAIDEVEQEVLGQLLTLNFPEKQKNCIVVNHNPSGQQGDNFSYTHEYAYFLHNSPGRHIAEQIRDDSKDWDVRNFRDVTGESSKRSAGRTCFYPVLVKNGEVIGFGDISDNDYHPNINEERDGIIYVYPIDPEGVERKWRFSRNTVESIKSELQAHFLSKRGVWDIKRVKKTFNYKSNWIDSRYSSNNHGTQLLNNLIPAAPASYPKSIFTVKDSLYAGLNGKSGLIIDFFAGSGTTGHAVIELNREYDKTNYFILVEQGNYFDTVLVPRVLKASYSSKWLKGKPANEAKPLSGIYKSIKIESYEDALNNLELKKPKADLFENNPELKDDYLLNYMLDVESRGSLLSTDDFKKPFDYTMKIAVDSAGAFEEQKVDLVETFNYLIGLTVKHIDAQPERGFVTVTGTLPSGETCLVLWRDCEKIDYQGLSKLCDKMALNPADNEFDVVYINGDHNIPTVLTQTAEEGGETRVLKLRQIEPEFLERMFAEEDA